MPAKSNLTDDEIRAALVATHGLRAAAAQRLGISYKTLARRLAANPSLCPPLAVDRVWERAVAGDAAIRAMCKRKGLLEFAVIHDRLGWFENQNEYEPTELSDEEFRELLRKLMANGATRVRFDVKEG